MRFAVPTRDGVVDDHFGHCDHYTVFTADDGTVTAQERLDSPTGCGCKSNIASVLSEQGVSVMLAGNIGQGAINVLANSGVKVIRGCQGPVSKVAEDFLAGRLLDMNIVCNHDCDHH